jgi:hypothetical protein
VLFIATQKLAPRPAGPLLYVLVLHFLFFSLARGSSAPGAGPSGVGGTRAMLSGEIWGGGGPAAGALIGLTLVLIRPPLRALRSPLSALRAATRPATATTSAFYFLHRPPPAFSACTLRTQHTTHNPDLNPNNLGATPDYAHRELS